MTHDPILPVGPADPEPPACPGPACSELAAAIDADLEARLRLRDAEEAVADAARRVATLAAEVDRMHALGSEHPSRHRTTKERSA